MSEFKYACPVCGQHMMCDSSQGGSVMECPTCFQKITAPQAPALDAKFILTGTKVGERRGSPGAGPGAGPAPGQKSFPAGVVIAVVVIGVAAGLYAFRGKIFKPARTSPPAANSSPGLVSPPAAPVPTVPAADAGNNLALNKPALASSWQAGHPMGDGNDGNSETRWCAANGKFPQWWEVDLGGPSAITNSQIVWEHEAVYKYVIQISPDNTRWTKLVDKTTNATPADMNTDEFSAHGRYVRVVVTGSSRGSWASFYEFKAFGAADSVASSTNVQAAATNQP